MHIEGMSSETMDGHHQLIHALHSKKKEDSDIPEWRVFAICMKLHTLQHGCTMCKVAVLRHAKSE